MMKRYIFPLIFLFPYFLNSMEDPNQKKPTCPPPSEFKVPTAPARSEGRPPVRRNLAASGAFEVTTVQSKVKELESKLRGLAIEFKENIKDKQKIRILLASFANLIEKMQKEIRETSLPLNYQVSVRRYFASLLLPLMEPLAEKLRLLREEAVARHSYINFTVPEEVRSIISEGLARIDSYAHELPFVKQEVNSERYAKQLEKKYAIHHILAKLEYELSQVGAIEGIFAIYHAIDEMPKERLMAYDSLYAKFIEGIRSASSLLEIIERLTVYFSTVYFSMAKYLIQKNVSDTPFVQVKELNQYLISRIVRDAIPKILKRRSEIPVIHIGFSSPQEMRKYHDVIYNWMSILAEQIEQYMQTYMKRDKEQVEQNVNTFLSLLYDLGFVQPPLTEEAIKVLQAQGLQEEYHNRVRDSVEHQLTPAEQFSQESLSHSSNLTEAMSQLRVEELSDSSLIKAVANLEKEPEDLPQEEAQLPLTDFYIPQQKEQISETTMPPLLEDLYSDYLGKENNP